jgi:aminopeptidase N
MRLTRSALAAAVLTACLVPSTARAAVPVPAGPSDGRFALPGARGLGDRLFPDLGNGGYEVDHYDLAMAYQPRSRLIRASTTVRARATQALSRFDLDFDAGTVTGVRVDGAIAGFSRRGAELIVTPGRSLPEGAAFTVRVQYVADPTAATLCRIPDIPARSAWFPTDDGFFTAAQPGCAHTVFPANDHPSDPASYSFAITVPAGLVAVTNGVGLGVTRHGGTTTWRYEQREPMASELIQIVVGHYRVIRGVGPRRLPLRSVVVAGREPSTRRAVSGIGQQLHWLEHRVGPFPFATYGVLAVAEFPSALETQTLSVFDVDDLTGPPEEWAAVAVHELTHQWFGDSVMPGTWSDLWLNEGHATWYEYVYEKQHGGPTLAASMHRAYRHSNRWRCSYGPPARPARPGTMFSPDVYDGGALALYALRQRVGARTFQRIERAWVTTYRGRSASTSDFIDLASIIARQDLHGFLDGWLYGRTVPDLPGHPTWRPLP